MNILDRTARTVAFVGAFGASMACGAAELTLEFGNVPDAPGPIMIAVFDSEETFRETPVANGRAEATSGAASTTLDLPAGTYAVTVFQDQDGDGTLDTNVLGLPTEPWAASNAGKTDLGPPSWTKTRFELSADGSVVRIDF